MYSCVCCRSAICARAVTCVVVRRGRGVLWRALERQLCFFFRKETSRKRLPRKEFPWLPTTAPSLTSRSNRGKFYPLFFSFHFIFFCSVAPVSLALFNPAGAVVSLTSQSENRKAKEKDPLAGGSTMSGEEGEGAAAAGGGGGDAPAIAKHEFKATAPRTSLLGECVRRKTIPSGCCTCRVCIPPPSSSPARAVP
jgi:hypothetical protein